MSSVQFSDLQIAFRMGAEVNCSLRNREKFDVEVEFLNTIETSDDGGSITVSCGLKPHLSPIKNSCARECASSLSLCWINFSSLKCPLIHTRDTEITSLSCLKRMRPSFNKS
jgi:hypothetical protein